jgi:hypothetical protein
MSLDLRPAEQLLFDFAHAAMASPCAEADAASGVRPRAASGEKSGAKSDATCDATCDAMPPVPASAMRSSPADVRRPRKSATVRSKAPTIATAPRPPRGIDHDRPQQRRFDAIVAEVLALHPLRVKRWRNTLSGVAVLRIFRDGREERTIEAPYPSSPLRLAIFLHEIGHHVLGLGVHRPRCLEEYLAWRYAIDRLVELGVPVEGPVARRFERSMRYAVAKAIRRGIRRLPVELVEFAPDAVREAIAARAARAA